MAKINTNTEVNFTICQTAGCRNFELTDKTGTYDVLNNPGGFGTPNTEISAVEQVYLDTIFPDGTEVTIDVTAIYPISLFPNLISQGVLITDTMGGLSDKYPDGVYSFTYRLSGSGGGITDSSWESSTQKYVLFTCQTQCAIDTMFSKVNPDDCSCDKDSALLAALKAQGFLKAACEAMACGQPNKALKLLKKAQFEASKNNCTSC